jgi:cytoskeletal protein CcmA (bactofilin family)
MAGSMAVRIARLRQFFLALAFVAIILLAVFVPRALAAQYQQGEQCNIAADVTIPGNLYNVCQNLVIDGTVQGDLVALAGNLIVNGTVEGDVLAAATSVTINGTVGGDVRALAARLVIAPNANLTAPSAEVGVIGLSAEIQGRVSGDVLFTGYQAILEGPISGSVRFNGIALALYGSTEGSVDAIIGSVPIQPPDLASLGIRFTSPGFALMKPGSTPASFQMIKGSLRLQSPQPVSVDSALVGGETNITRTSTGDIIGIYIERIIHDLLALMVVGLVALLVVQGSLEATDYQLRAHAPQSLGIGLAVFILAFPATALLGLISLLIVGLVHLLTLGELTMLAGLVLIIVNLILVGAGWFVIAFLSRVIVCYMIGNLIGRRILPASDRATTLIISMLIGVLVYAALANLPPGIFGLIINVVGVSFGLGAIILAVHDVLKRRVAPGQMPVAVRPTAQLLTGAVPSNGFITPPTDKDIRVGMDNLPDGFTWWQDEE